MNIPVITVDGPSGSGKGTISQLIAKQLNWHWLDSGALYRLLALAAQKRHIAIDNVKALEALALQLNVRFIAENAWSTPQIILDGEDVSVQLRQESCGLDASKIAVIAEVRKALLDRQRAFRELPGLVADGRDMGTVVFPDAQVKFFLLASAEERANRRFRQLQKAGMPGDYDTILAELLERDTRDKTRTAAPLVPASDAILIDTTPLSIEEVLTNIMQVVKRML